MEEVVSVKLVAGVVKVRMVCQSGLARVGSVGGGCRRRGTVVDLEGDGVGEESGLQGGARKKGKVAVPEVVDRAGKGGLGRVGVKPGHDGVDGVGGDVGVGEESAEAPEVAPSAQTIGAEEILRGAGKQGDVARVALANGQKAAIDNSGHALELRTEGGAEDGLAEERDVEGFGGLIIGAPANRQAKVVHAIGTDRIGLP